MAAMKPHKRAVAVTGSYTDRQGAEKKRYTTVGTLFKYDDGNFALKLDAVPVGDGWNGFISFYDLEERRDDANPRREQTREQPKQGFSADLDDEIPF